MAPIARWTIKFTQAIKKNADLRNKTLTLVEVVSQKKDCAHFKYALVRNPRHTSHPDPKSHATVNLSTDDQEKRGVSQTVHIYHDAQGAYAGHVLYPERPNKKTDQE